MIARFLSGAICVAFFVAGLIFLKFWRSARETLFLLFALAFALLGVERILILLLFTEDANAPSAYLIRLVAYSLIIAGIISKNRR